MLRMLQILLSLIFIIIIDIIRDPQDFYNEDCIRIASNSIIGAGIEPALVGAAAASAKGARIETIKGNNAAYVAEVVENESKEADLDAARVAYMQQFESFAYLVNSIVTDVEVDDNRIKFY